LFSFNSWGLELKRAARFSIPDFGKIANALDPRNIQMSLKLIF
jgi:hypothetical protein